MNNYKLKLHPAFSCWGKHECDIECKVESTFQGGQHPEVPNDYVSSQLFMFKLNCVQPTKENYLFVKVDVFLPKRETFTVGCCGDKGGRPGYGWVFLLTADLLTVLGVSVEPPVAPSTPGISTI